MALVPGGDQGELTEKQYKREQVRRRATRFYFIDDLRKPTRAELEEAAAHLNHEVEAHSHGHPTRPPTKATRSARWERSWRWMVTTANANSRPGRTSPSSTTRPLAELT